jgi:hypothetical protein
MEDCGRRAGKSFVMGKIPTLQKNPARLPDFYKKVRCQLQTFPEKSF